MDPFRFGKRRVNVQPRRGDKVTGVKFRGSFRNSGALPYRANIQDRSRFVDKKFEVVINWQESYKVTTTFPRACRSSRFRIASGTSLKL